MALTVNEGFYVCMRLNVLVLRVALGLLFAFLLTYFFFPSAGKGTALAVAVLLVFFAYVFEYIHKNGRY